MDTSVRLNVEAAIQKIPFYKLKDNIDLKFWRPLPFKKKCEYRYDTSLLENYLKEKRPLIMKGNKMMEATEEDCLHSGFWTRTENRGSAAPPCRENAVMVTHLI